MDVSTTVKKLGLEQAFRYLYKDPEQNLLKLMDWADKFARGEFAPQRAVLREVIENPDHPYHQYVLNLFRNVDEDVVKTIGVNFFINANLVGWSTQEEARRKYGCNVPWAILLDPTSACNLHCTGCWAAEYGNKLNLSFDEIDDIIRQGKELGVYMYIYTGGEPLVRKRDLIRLCEKHSDCVFLCFTNATLIDEAFADEMLRVKNFVPAISLEGFEEATDGRRGKGTYEKVIRTMELILSGISTICRWATTPRPRCFPPRSSVWRSITASAVCGGSSPCLPWTSRMTRNMWAAVSPAAGGICTSTPTAMWTPACLSTILTATSGKRRCWSVSGRRFSWPITTVSPSTRICSGLVPCWKILSFCGRWSTGPAPSPQTCSRLRAWTTCAANARPMQRTGSLRRSGFGRRPRRAENNKVMRKAAEASASAAFGRVSGKSFCPTKILA